MSAGLPELKYGFGLVMDVELCLDISKKSQNMALVGVKKIAVLHSSVKAAKSAGYSRVPE